MYDFFFVFQWLASNDTKSTIKSLQRLFKNLFSHWISILTYIYEMRNFEFIGV